ARWLADGGTLAVDRGADAGQGAGLWGAQGRALRGGHGVAPRPHVLGVCRCEHRGVGATPAGWRGSTSWGSIGLIPLRRLTGRGWAEHRTGADALQLTLVPRFSFRARLSAGVRLARGQKFPCLLRLGETNPQRSTPWTHESTVSRWAKQQQSSSHSTS